MVTRRELLTKFRTSIKKYLDKHFKDCPNVTKLIKELVDDTSDEVLVMKLSIIQSPADFKHFEDLLLDNIKQNIDNVEQIDPVKIEKLRDYITALAKLVSNIL